MKKYVCVVCGYIYDPISGDKTQGVSDGVAFEALPAGWHCPVCGVTRGDFSPW
ncbi:MAG: rubredoxin [Nitrospirae bacterium]|nr:rubredoxin [Nitrospirota bacterium]MBF0591705.1 rubredoxin [Nitrospirota bacterium]